MTRALKILLVFSLHVHVLAAQLQVRNFFSLAGRRDLSVNVIIQEKSGHLLLGTESGIYRFDGREAVPVFAHFRQLSSNISELHFAGEDTLLIGTMEGGIYRLCHGRLDSLRSGSPLARITDFHVSGGKLFIGTYGDGLLCYEHDSIIVLDTKKGLSDNVIYTITGDGDGTVWCGTDAGISEIHPSAGNFSVNVISSRDGLPDNIVRRLLMEDGKLLVAMQDSGVCHYHPITKKFSRDRFFATWSLGPVLEARTLGSSLYIATEKKGIIQINQGAFTVCRYDEIGLQGINSVFFDHAEQLWIASRKGLSRLSEKRVNMIGQQHGLIDNKVLALAVDNNNVIWSGTAQGLSMIMTDDNGKIVVKKEEDLSGYTISCAVKAPNGDMWFGTYGSGLIIVNTINGTHRFINSATHNISNDNISSIFFGTDGRVYIATLGGGLMVGVADAEQALKVTTVYNQEAGLGSNYVYSAVCDRSGQLYVATDGGGLEVLDNQRFINLTKRFRLASNNVFSLCVDDLNNVWAVSNTDGILRYDRQTLRSFRRGDGLRDEQPPQIIANGEFIYAVHTKGIDKIRCSTGQVSYYDVPDEPEPNLNAIVIARDRLFSGTNSGVLVYRTSQVATDSARPTVFISSVTVNYRSVDTDSSSRFSYDDNNFAVSFSGVWLKDPDKLTYRYRLEGLENEWQLANDGKTVNYNNLRPGTYSFVVQSRNEEDVWSRSAKYSFTIGRPFWQQWWFWGALAASVAAGIWLFVRFRIRALQRENILLEKRVTERTAEIEKQARIIEIKNHELEQLSLVASKTDNAVLILDPSGRLEYVNESFVRQHRMNIDELRHRYGETIYELSNHDGIRDLISNALNNRRSVTYESQNKKEEAGTGTWQSSTLTPIFSEDGSLKKIIIIDSDVTDRKRQEQIIVQKNKDITDSISYARKIQHAILPGADIISGHLPHHFCLYLTKDIVSGDFYWFSHLQESSIIAAVDCTGHGVPGAFMSLIGYNLLNRIVNENRLTEPGQILLELNKGVIQALHKNDSSSRDGMDIAICKINHRENTLEYAGAMRPLWIFNSGEFSEIRPDKIPIGTLEHERQLRISFTTHSIKLKQGDRYFIFTDGYADQFGGDKDKKFSTARLKELLRTTSDLPLVEQEKKLRQEHILWKGVNEQIDDILVIGFEVAVKPQDP